MAFTYTKEQLDAIEARGENILVSAAAGSGKTALLTERLARFILRGETSVDRLLVVTFTKAAAHEMKERFRRRLQQALTGDDPERLIRKKDLAAQIARLEDAQFSTMDAFAYKIVREYFPYTDLSPNVSFGDSAELIDLRKEAIEEALEEMYGSDDAQMKELSDLYGSFRGDEELKTLIDDILTFFETLEDEDSWSVEMLSAMEEEDLLEEAIYAALFEEINATALDALRMVEKAYELWEEGCSAPVGKFLEKDAEFYRSILDAKSLKEALSSIGERASFARASFPRAGNMDADLKDEIKGLRDKAKESIKEYQGLSQAAEKEVFYMREMKGRIENLLTLAKKAAQRYEELKKSRNRVDFAQVSKAVLTILENEEAREEISSRYDVAFFDEYQDTNGVQERIVSQIANPGSRFMVGDLKQSIYRFRKADPEIFIEKYDSYAKGEGGRRILLNRNFRSAPEILEGINVLFRKIMSKRLGDIDYDDDVALIPGRGDLRGREPELHLIPTAKEDILSPLEAETQHIATFIKQELSKNPEKSYRDFVILHRSANAVSQEMVRILSQNGIPVVSESQEAFFDSVEVRTVLDLLAIVDNFYQDLPLMSVLSSPIGNFSLEEISKIRKFHIETKEEGRKEAFYEAFFQYARSGDDPSLREKVSAFEKKIRHFRSYASIETADAFISRLLEQTGYDLYVRSLPEGSVRSANLEMLMQKAQAYQQSSFKGIAHFLQYIAKLKKRNTVLLGDAISAESPDAVTLMSVHKSKGLEFDTVILAGAGKNFNQQDLRQNLILHKRFGFGTLYRYLSGGIAGHTSTINRRAFQSVLRQESLSEEMRLLYVALTRAERRLIVTGTIDAGKMEKFTPEEDLSAQKLLSGKNLLDWILPALVKRELTGEKLVMEAGWSGRIVKPLRLERTEKREEEESLPPSPEILDELREVLRPKRKKEIYYPTRMSVSKLKKYQTPFSPEGAQEVVELASGKQLEIEEIDENEPFPREENLVVQEETLLDLIDEDSSVLETEQLEPWRLPESKQVGEGARRGILIHRFMERLNLPALAEAETIRSALSTQLATLTESGFFTEEERSLIDLSLPESFYRSQEGQELLSAVRRDPACVLKEYPFILQMDAHTIDPKVPVDESTPIQIQGVIDLAYLTADGWVLIDYKTDRLSRLPEEMRKARLAAYRSQVRLYKRALEELTGESVHKALLSFLRERQTLLVEDMPGEGYGTLPFPFEALTESALSERAGE